MRLRLAALVLLLPFVAVPTAAFSQDSATLPSTPDCSLVREAVKQHGVTKAYVWAVSQGYSQRAIAQVRRTCGV